MNLKYTIEFETKEGVTTIQFLTSDLVERVVELQATNNPLVITYDGDQFSHFQIITSRVSINFISQMGVFEDLASISDMQYWVDITTPKMTWGGWLIADNMQRYLTVNGYEITIVAKDPFTAMKAKTPINNPWTYYGKGFVKLKEVLSNCVNIVTPESFDINVCSDIFAITPNNVIIPNSPAVFEDLIRPESMIDDNGGQYAYDIVDTVVKSFPYKVLFFNKSLWLLDYIYISKKGLDANVYTYKPNGILLYSKFESVCALSTMDDDPENFLIGSLDKVAITMVPALKEVVSKYSNEDYISGLQNPSFIQGNADYWNLDTSAPALVSETKVGNGDRFNPYAIRIKGSNSKYDNSRPLMYQVCPIKALKGDSATLDISWRGTNVGVTPESILPDYAGIVDSMPTVIPFNVGIVSDANANGWNDISSLYCYGMGGDKRNAAWRGKSDYGGWAFYAQAAYRGYKIDENIVYTSTLNISALPSDGYLVVLFYPPYLFQFPVDVVGNIKVPVNADSLNKYYYDLVSVKLSINTASTNIRRRKDDTVKQESFSLLQYVDYSMTGELDVSLNEKYAETGRYAIYTRGSVVTMDDDPKMVKAIHYRKETDDIKLDLMHRLIRDYMSIRRTPKYQVSCSFISQNITPISLFGIKNFRNNFTAVYFTYRPLVNECESQLLEYSSEYLPEGTPNTIGMDVLSYDDGLENGYDNILYIWGDMPN